MTDKITYYAMTDEHTSREKPRTVLRRVENDEGQVDELFSRDLTWQRSPLLHVANRGDTRFDFGSSPCATSEASRLRRLLSCSQRQRASTHGS